LGSGTQTITTVSGEDNDQIVVDFAAAIHPDGAEDPANFVLSDGANVDITDASFSFDGTDQVTIDLGSANIETAGTYSLTVDNIMSIQGVAQTSASTEAAISPTGDTTAPSIGVNDARIDPQTANSILVTFDEAVSETGGIDITNYTIGGNTTTAAAFVTPRVVRVTFQNAVAIAETVDVLVAAATDLAGNVAAGTASLAIAAADATAPTISAIAGDTATSNGLHQITLTFDESVPFAAATTAGNYAITSAGVPVSLTDASISASSAGDIVTIELPASVRLTTGDALSVVAANVADAAGNAVSSAAVAGTVAGDNTGPASATAFVNLREMATGEIVDVYFNEAMDQTTTETIGNWSGSNGQAATSVMMINDRLFRVTFDAAFAPSDTIDAATPTDVAGNAGATITVNPIE
ncbi:MAG: hypothetical protein AAGG01_07535, partial [Planctomycetota bacterium]